MEDLVNLVTMFILIGILFIGIHLIERNNKDE